MARLNTKFLTEEAGWQVTSDFSKLLTTPIPHDFADAVGLCCEGQHSETVTMYRVMLVAGLCDSWRRLIHTRAGFQSKVIHLAEMPQAAVHEVGHKLNELAAEHNRCKDCVDQTFSGVVLSLWDGGATPQDIQKLVKGMVLQINVSSVRVEKQHVSFQIADPNKGRGLGKAGATLQAETYCISIRAAHRTHKRILTTDSTKQAECRMRRLLLARAASDSCPAGIGSVGNISKTVASITRVFRATSAWGVFQKQAKPKGLVIKNQIASKRHMIRLKHAWNGLSTAERSPYVAQAATETKERRKTATSSLAALSTSNTVTLSHAQNQRLGRHQLNTTINRQAESQRESWDRGLGLECANFALRTEFIDVSAVQSHVDQQAKQIFGYVPEVQENPKTTVKEQLPCFHFTFGLCRSLPDYPLAKQLADELFNLFVAWKKGEVGTLFKLVLPTEAGAASSSSPPGADLLATAFLIGSIIKKPGWIVTIKLEQQAGGVFAFATEAQYGLPSCKVNSMHVFLHDIVSKYKDDANFKGQLQGVVCQYSWIESETDAVVLSPSHELDSFLLGGGEWRGPARKTVDKGSLPFGLKMPTATKKTRTKTQSSDDEADAKPNKAAAKRAAKALTPVIKQMSAEEIKDSSHFKL